MNWLRLFPPLLAFLLRLIPGPRIIDDAYITFCYARNLITGNGLVFNPGEPVLGTTTPLYTFLLASFSTVFGLSDLPVLAWLLNALVDSVGVTLVYWLGKRLTGSWVVGIGTAVLWAVAPFSVTFAIGGLETSLVISLLLAAFAMFLSGRDRWAALALGLATLTRPDMLIAALLIFSAMGWPWLRQRLSPGAGEHKNAVAFPLGPAVVFLLTLAPWLIFAALTYGSPLPNSLAAKSVAYQLPREAAVVRMIQHAATPFHEQLIQPQLAIAGFLLYPALFAAGALHATRSDRRAWPLFAYPFLYAAVYSVANPLIFRWYLSPPVPFYFLGILTGLWGLASLVPAIRGHRARQSGLVAVASMLALGMSLNAWTLRPPGPPEKPAPEMAWIKLEVLYHQVAQDIIPEMSASNGRLAAGDIGVLGWFTEAPILDLVGLVSPQASDYYPLSEDAYVINYAVSPELILTEQPGYVVILEVYGRNTLSRNRAFQSFYELWREYPTDIYGSTSMQVFRLRAS